MIPPILPPFLPTCTHSVAPSPLYHFKDLWHSYILLSRFRIHPGREGQALSFEELSVEELALVASTHVTEHCHNGVARTKFTS